MAVRHDLAGLRKSVANGGRRLASVRKGWATVRKS
jgi:hypothetical protein